MNNKTNIVVVAFNDDWERHNILLEYTALNIENAIQLFEGELKERPTEFEEFDNLPVWFIDLETLRVKKVYLTKSVQVNISDD